MNTSYLRQGKTKGIQSSLEAALKFLSQRQFPHGEFPTYAAENRKMNKGCKFDSTPFTTAFILYSLGFYHHTSIGEITARGLQFLQAEMKGPGLWRYWSSHHQSHAVLPPDLDDTSCISFVLKQNRISIANHKIILANRNPDGLFYTWLFPREPIYPELKKEISRWTKARSIPFFSITGTLDNVDHAVNANVLLYLGECKETQPVIDYVKQNLAERAFPGTSYYADGLVFYYLVSRAYHNGVISLQETRNAILPNLLTRKKSNGSFGSELLTALAICTALNFHEARRHFDDSISYLLRAQRENGSWKKSPCWLGPAPYYGSEELTTAFCVEALARYIQ